MDFTYDEEQRAVADLARKIFAQRVTQTALRATEAEADRFDRSLWKDLAEAGLLGVSIPVEHGGSGHGLLPLAALLVEAGAVTAHVPLWATLVLGAAAIDAFGSEAQKREILPRVAGGDCLLAAALVETKSEDPEAPTTTARKDGDEWVLDGEKTCIAAGHVAERILVAARTGNGTLGVFLVDPTARGVTLDRQIVTNDSVEARLTMTGVRVSRASVLGDPTAGLAIVRFLVARGLAGLCALELGVAERALQMSATYTSSREQFDRPIATFQAVAQRLADAYIDLECVRLATWRAVYCLHAGLPAEAALATAKFWASEGGHRVVLAAQHVHGGMGYDRDYPLFRHYTWSRHLELTLGGATRQLVRLGELIASSEER